MRRIWLHCLSAPNNHPHIFSVPEARVKLPQSQMTGPWRYVQYLRL